MRRCDTQSIRELCYCVVCNGDLTMGGHDLVVCIQCKNTYPVVDGIPVFMRRGSAVLEAYIQELRSERERASNIAAQLGPLMTNKGHELFQRAERMISGISHNVELMAKHCRPIREYTRRVEVIDDLPAWASIQTGFPYREMLPYFFQDWYGTREFERVKEAFVGAVGASCSERKTMTVLGAGACGLFFTLADHFNQSFAVDLSLPTLLAAKHLIYGEPVSVRLEQTDWRKVDLAPPTTPGDKDMTFMVANVMTLPFRDESMSVVVTQYLMDIVGNSNWLMEEIWRVLSPQGVWINFSQPFRAPNDPLALRKRKLLEVAPVLTAIGFETKTLESRRFKLLNVEEIWTGGDRRDQEVHFLVAQKSGSPRELQPCGANRRLVGDAVLWDRVPKVVTEREVALVQRRRFSLEGLVEEWEISVAGRRVPVSEQSGSLFAKLLSHIDGTRSVRELWKVLHADNCGLGEQEFLELMRCLNADHFVVEFVNNMDHLGA